MGSLLNAVFCLCFSSTSYKNVYIKLSSVENFRKNCSFSSSDVQSLYFTTTPKDVTFLNTRTTRIECSAQGIPKPTISWEMSDGTVVRNITGIRQVRYDGSLQFLAFNARNLDAHVHRTKYRCIAKSDIGRLRSETINVHASM